MLLEKDRILQALRERGLHQRADFVDGQLPDLVDSQDHSGLLAMLGLNPRDLINEPSER